MACARARRRRRPARALTSDSKRWAAWDAVYLLFLALLAARAALVGVLARAQPSPRTAEDEAVELHEIVGFTWFAPTIDAAIARA